MSSTDAMEHPGPPMSKTAYVLDRMRGEIASGAIIPGESLKQTDLAARYGVSPTPVREALRLLQAEGTISYSPHRGATVAGMDAERVRDLYLLRATMESLATRIAVERLADDSGTLELVQKLHRELSRGRTKLSGSELAQLNKTLHFAIYSSGSTIIAEHINSLWRLIPPTVTMWDQPRITKVLVAQHAKIIEAFASRDAPAAAELMSEHVMTAARFREQQLGH